MARREPIDWDKISPGNMNAKARKQYERRQLWRKWWWAPTVSVLLLAWLWNGVKGDSQTIATVCDKVDTGYVIITSDEPLKVDNILGSWRFSKGNAALYGNIQEDKTYAFTYEGLGFFTPHNIVRVSEAPASEAQGTCPK